MYCILIYLSFTLEYCIGFAIHQHESPWVYTCSPSWTPLPPPSPYHPSGSSQCTLWDYCNWNNICKALHSDWHSVNGQLPLGWLFGLIFPLMVLITKFFLKGSKNVNNFNQLFLLLFFNIFKNWSVVNLQYCISFRYTSKWFIYI